MSHIPEHPFLTAVRLAAQVGAPHIYTDPSMPEPVVVLSLRQYQELLGGAPVAPEPVKRAPVAPSFQEEPENEEFFDPEAVAAQISKRNQGWQQVPSAGEEGHYLHPIPRRPKPSAR